MAARPLWRPVTTDELRSTCARQPGARWRPPRRASIRSWRAPSQSSAAHSPSSVAPLIPSSAPSVEASRPRAVASLDGGEQARHDHAQYEVALAGPARVGQRRQLQRAGRAQGRRDVAVGPCCAGSRRPTRARTARRRANAARARSEGPAGGSGCPPSRSAPGLPRGASDAAGESRTSGPCSADGWLRRGRRRLGCPCAPDRRPKPVHRPT